MKVVVLFQGGGSLGAFACGVWKALAPLLQQAGAQLVGVGGASIGAVNSALIARHHADPDLGAGRLEHFWRERIATPSLPFLGPAGNAGGLWPFEAWWPGQPAARSWNGVLTGLLVGNRALYRANPAHWTPWAALQRVHLPLLDRSRMWSTLHEVFGSYRSNAVQAPWLGVPAVDVQAGELRLFDSDRETVTPAHLAASTAIPLMFEPVEIDGRLYWDGDLIRHSMVPLALQALHAHGRLQDGDDTLLVSVEQVARRAAARPVAGLELAARLLDLLQLDKFSAAEAAHPGIGRVLRIRREAFPHDTISGHFDYSPERIDELIAQGERLALQAWQEPAPAAPEAASADPAATPRRRSGSAASPTSSSLR
ncbi:patatin-like phospholipase family protein [Aquabacterium sp. A7-Y]|uniref:patatin-like phospholipase family protein n=1 Tax=Aquabacterium sp. A7-Y TaxID=1349605 RepID=UPI00223DC96C|nr:patatin-like phospholipase family protein [Aquabacterium sp. A7-Y]MCW7537382.1 patatin-like phospholipase family protein [Aquabacterium sp. A7-Y]